MASRNLVFVALFVLLQVFLSHSKLNLKSITGIYDVKVFKKFLKTHKNVVVVFSKNDKSAIETIRWAEGVAKEMKGQGNIVYINCGEDKESKKLCKKHKANPNPLAIKHYKDGSFHKVYDRKHVAKSLLNFMRDPTGDAPWEEDTTANDVVHVNSEQEFIKLRRKEKGSLLVMFYAPWCGHCKRLKPEFSAAASEIKGKATLAGLDCDRPALQAVRHQFNITGYPTLIYFEKGEEKFHYGGKYSKEGIIEWLEDPEAPKKEPEATEAEWKDEPSDVMHLTSDNFDATVANSTSVLVMFYAPWCGHCKKMKPEYVEAAKRMKDESINGILAAVDCTKEQALAKRYDISGFPTVKYFSEGEVKFKFTERVADKIVDFMKDPKEPPPPPPPDQPWSETSNKEVLHLDDATFKDSLKKRKHVLIMFYAPWCGHCKAAKPEYEQAALDFEDDRKVSFAAVDCTISQATCESYGVSGYPTFKYVSYGKKTIDYKSGRQHKDFVEFMKDPKEAPPPPPPEPEWSDVPSKVNHLSDDNFDSFMKDHKSVLVMFYAPWCGHCKAMKPAYQEAAEELYNKNAAGVLAAVDCTKNPDVQKKYEVRGFPTLKYFSNGEMKMKYESGRTKDKIIRFMMRPEDSVPPPVKDWSKEAKDVAFPTSQNFDEFAKDKRDLLVMFYAPWCGHCNKMKPAYFEAAKVLKETMPKAVLAAVDCTVQTELASRFQVQGYPTLKYFRNGKHAADYEKGRGIDDIISFMETDTKLLMSQAVVDRHKWSDLPSRVIHLKADDFSSSLAKEEHALVMFHTIVSKDCLAIRKSYMRAASRKAGSQFKFAALDCDDYAEFCKENKIELFPTIKYYNKGKSMDNMDVTEDSKPEAFTNFLEQKSKSRKEEL